MQKLLKIAIKKKCTECGGSFFNPCPSKECPLFPYRIGKLPVDYSSRKAIREYCLFCMNFQPREILKCEETDCPFNAYRSQRA